MLKENGALSDAKLSKAAEDVAAAAKRRPKWWTCCWRSPTWSACAAQLAGGAADPALAERDAAIRDHRAQAYKNLKRGLELLAKQGRGRPTIGWGFNSRGT